MTRIGWLMRSSSRRASPSLFPSYQKVCLPNPARPWHLKDLDDDNDDARLLGRPRTVQLSKYPFSRRPAGHFHLTLLSRIISLRDTDRRVSPTSPDKFIIVDTSSPCLFLYHFWIYPIRNVPHISHRITNRPKNKDPLDSDLCVCPFFLHNDAEKSSL